MKKVLKTKDVEKAYLTIERLYNESVSFLTDNFVEFTKGKTFKDKVRAFYPYVRIDVKTANRSDTRYSYGFASRPGAFMTTITRPDLFDYYYREQFTQLIKNHDTPIEIGISDVEIPLHFALGEGFHLEDTLSEKQMEALPYLFTQPNLDDMDDSIANGTFYKAVGAENPLALFQASRVDLSLLRLKHYTATLAEHFQNYVIFTNYQFYIDEFVKIGQELMAQTDDPKKRAESEVYSSFVEPGNKVTVNKNFKIKGEEDEEGTLLARMPQMPAYHLKRPDGSGITMVNIGVGPSNAKTITDHIAVLRPHAWLMLGHCAGLRNSQSMGDYVLAHGYLREDHVLDQDLDPTIPIPALSEIQVALEQAVSEITGHQGYDLKKLMRTGTVATIDDRNWELRPAIKQNRKLSQSRAIALDMESGTIAANGFRFRVPYGTLLCVSDKPLHGQLKLPGMAENFYRQRVEQHLQIGLLTMSLLREIGPARLHSRKLRSFYEVAFQ